MAAITVKCPECESSMKVAEESAGKKVRCKECEHVFVVKAPAAQSAARKDDKGAKAPAKGDKAKAITTKPVDKDKGKPAPKKPAAKAEAKKPDFDPDFDQDKDPYGMTEHEIRARCPECANEMESEDAVVCLHCGFNTMTRSRATKRKVQEVTGGDVFLKLLGILCVLGIIITLVIVILYQLNAKKWYNEPDWDWYNWLGHGFFQLWFWIIWCFTTFYQGRFAVKRLLINNTPPEVEIK